MSEESDTSEDDRRYQEIEMNLARRREAPLAQDVQEVVEKMVHLIMDGRVDNGRAVRAVQRGVAEAVAAQGLQSVPVVFNRCFGGFGLTKEFKAFRREWTEPAASTAFKLGARCSYDIERVDLAPIIEAFGARKRNEDAPEDTDDPKVDEENKRRRRKILRKQDASDMDVGLVFAADRCSRLAVALVPQIVEWRIGEYDGNESVVVYEGGL